jgi:sugar/nucleoside kinase (ribokinase family)
VALGICTPRTRVAHEFVTVGHVTMDRFTDGREQLGGSAFYSAVLAARCGLDVALVTAGDPDQLGRSLAPYADSMDILVQKEATTTTLLTWTVGHERRQRVVLRARTIDPVSTTCDVLHMAPVLQEIVPEWIATSAARISGITPQGLIRSWDASGLIALYRRPDLASYRADVAVLGEGELPYCQDLVEAIQREHGTVVITRAAGPAEVRVGNRTWQVKAFPTQARDDVGAGDVFAAALLVALRDSQPAGEAVRFAHAAASLRVAQRGPHAIPTRRSIEERCNAMRRGARPEIA